MTDVELQMLMASMDMLNQSVATATNVVATNNLNEKNRQWQSLEASKARDWSSKEAELAYERQLEYFDSKLSPSAQVQQYKDAGLNPALMFSKGASTTSSSAPQASAIGSSNGSVATFQPMHVFSMLEAVMSIQRQKAEINKINAETSQVSKETSWIDAYNTASIDSMRANINKVRSDIDVNKSLVDKNIQDVMESMSRISVNESTIQVNGALVDLHGSQQVLNECRSAVERLNAQTIKEMLPYVQARQEAEIALTNAKTEEARFSAEDKMYDANLKYLRALVDAKLIDSSYYDSVIDQAHWSVKAKKREYKWQPINDICHNLSMLMIGAGSIMSGVGSAASGLGQAGVVFRPRNSIVK